MTDTAVITDLTFRNEDKLFVDGQHKEQWFAQGYTAEWNVGELRTLTPELLAICEGQGLRLRPAKDCNETELREARTWANRNAEGMEIERANRQRTQDALVLGKIEAQLKQKAA